MGFSFSGEKGKQTESLNTVERERESGSSGMRERETNSISHNMTSLAVKRVDGDHW